MKYLVTTAAAAIALAVSGVSAQAACGSFSHSNLFAGQHVKLPPAPSRGSMANLQRYSSIVGMWHVQYLVSGNLAFQSFQQWHVDNTEFEFADIPTITGDICMGVWNNVGRAYNLYHTAWTFDDNGNPNGTMVLTHVDRLNRRGDAFAGTFDLKFYDSNGNLINEITGDTQADRITGQ
ncbi:MAG TPA: hypothetical protein VHT03_06570 [Rhizomicrobium sp.]|nr:hypothetical protein [Rhizomicrobium sp.]